MPKLRQPQYVRDYADELRKLYGGMMTVTSIAEELGKVSRSTAFRFVQDIPAVIVNGKKRYKVTEVAKKILECEE